METAYNLLLLFFVLGLILFGAVFITRKAILRRVLLTLALIVVNLGALAVLLATFLVSRLDGSGPPGPGPLFAPLWLPLLLIIALDGVILYFNARVRT